MSSSRTPDSEFRIQSCCRIPDCYRVPKRCRQTRSVASKLRMSECGLRAFASDSRVRAFGLPLVWRILIPPCGPGWSGFSRSGISKSCVLRKRRPITLGKTLSQIAFAWLLAVRGVTSVIIGARNLAQLQENMGAGGWDFPSEQWKKLDDASALPSEYPQDFQSWVEQLMHSDADGN